MKKNCMVCGNEFKVRNNPKGKAKSKLGVNRVNCTNKKCSDIYKRIYRYITSLRREEGKELK